MRFSEDTAPDFVPLKSNTLNTDDHEIWSARGLALPLPAFSPDVSCSEAHEYFLIHPDQIAIAIVEKDGSVAGLVSRLGFFARYAQRYMPELYGRRSIQELANRHPVLIDEDMSVADVAALLSFAHPEAMQDCFVITHQGQYLGIGTGEALMRSKVSLLTLREKQLHQALVAAEEAYRSKSTFLALMSHELRTPLNAILGFSEILSREEFGPVGVPRYREYADDIHRAGAHLLSLINDILDLSKAEAGRMDLVPEPVALPDFLEHCRLFVAGRAKEHGIQLRIRVPERLPQLQADPLRLKQIVLNLLSNAVKFTLSGGRVSLLADENEAGEICISVRDTGIGMAAADIPRALEPFRQIASPDSRREEGTGLGLSLVKTLTELHGGRLEIHSIQHKGTQVRVIFPAFRTLHPAAQPPVAGDQDSSTY